MTKMTKIGGHVKSWHKVNVKTYTPAEQVKNLEEFLAMLPTLPLARLKDVKRRDRLDPRTLPAGTPLCVADHVWRIYSCGARAAFGLDQGSVERLVQANDDGASAEKLRKMIAQERAKLVAGALSIEDYEPTWWNTATALQKGEVALALHEKLGLSQSQIGLHFGIKQVAVSMAVRKAGLIWPSTRTTKSSGRSKPTQSEADLAKIGNQKRLISNVEQYQVRLNKAVARARKGGVSLELSIIGASADSSELDITMVTRSRLNQG